MQQTIDAAQTLNELATLRRQLSRGVDGSARYRVGNEIFKRANALWRDGLLTAADYLQIRDEVDSATQPGGN